MLNEKYIISEFYDFSADRKIIEEAEKLHAPIILKGILQKADTENRNGRVYPYSILKREADKYDETVRDNRAIGECVPAKTKVYTKDGWKNIEEIKSKEKIYTLNINTNKLEIQSVSNTIEKQYNDDMIHIYNNNSLDMMVTKNHKVVLWDRNNNPYILTALELYDKLKNNDSKVNHSYIKHSGDWDGIKQKYFTLPNTKIKIKTEDWAAFLGIYISEGHCSGSRGGENRKEIGITQVKKESKEKIKKLLDKLPFKYHIPKTNRQFIIKNEDLYNHLKDLGNSYQKYIPDYAKKWSPDILETLLEWLLIGDGKNRKSPNGNLLKEYFTTSKKLSEDVFEIMLKIGNGATINSSISKDRFIYDEKIITKEVDCGDGTIELVKEKVKVKRLIESKNSKPLFLIHERTTKGICLDSRFIKYEKIPFNDYVYCVSVPNKTWLMKFNDKISWTHNCDHPDSAVVSLANVSHMVKRMWWENKTLYGEVQIVDTPAGGVLKGLLKSGVKLGISSRGIGSVKKVDERDVVQDDFELISFDFVSSPSTPGAYLFKESKNWGLTKLTNEHIKVIKTSDLKDACSILSEGGEENKFKNLIDISKNKFWSI